jgi:hypothetical protein
MNIRGRLSRFGFRKTLFDIMLRILYRSVKGQIFYCMAWSSAELTKNSLNSYTLSYPFGFMELDQLLPLIKPEEMTMTHEFARQAFAKGDKCFVVMDKGNLAHYSWYASSPTNVVGSLQFIFPKDKVYMFNAFTNHQYRGEKLYPQAVRQAVKSYVNQGYNGALTLIAANNFSSISAVRQIGFSTIGKFYISSAGRSCVYSSKRCMNNGIILKRSK